MKNYLLKYFLFISIVTLFVSCSSDEDAQPGASSITVEIFSQDLEKTFTSLKINGDITLNGGEQLTTKGVCWSTNPNPTINDHVILETNNTFTTTIPNLNVDTLYYVKVFVTKDEETIYSEELMVSTLSLENSVWKVSTIYPDQNDFEIQSKVDFFADSTTEYDELDMPGQCPGCFITNGTWTTNENDITYIWEGSDPDTSTYVYYGVVDGMNISGTYTHTSQSNGTWSATPL